MKQQEAYHNYGLSGQDQDDYDYLFCGKRCKRRKAKKRAIRFDRRRLKNDERRARIERMRAETKIMSNTLGSSKKATTKMPVTGQRVNAASAINANPAPQKAGGKMMMILGVALLGGFLFFNNKQGGPVQMQPQSAPNTGNLKK